MDSRMLGDYRLIEPLAQHPDRTTWLAEQVSIQRPVVLVELTELTHRENFLADIRAKAAVDHPLIGSIYEAVSEDNQCYVALERLPGHTITDRIALREGMRPVEFAHVMRRLAEAVLHLRAKEIATEPLTTDSLHLDANGVIRIENIALAGPIDPDAENADIARLGKALPAVVADGHPGTSRALTVLAWMRGEGIERNLTWEEIRSYAEQIEGQLLEATPTNSPAPGTSPVTPRKSPLPVLLGAIAGLLLLGGAVAVFLPKGPKKETTTPLPLPAPITIPAGTYPTPDGSSGQLPSFRISPHEVTIGEYLNFLEVLEQLEPSEQDAFDHDKQPEEKADHIPEGWEEMLAAARQQGSWQEMPISLNHPIVNIDWWDATAYANWKGQRLPTQEEWFAAMRQKVEKPEFIQPAPWRPVVSDDILDQTPTGMRGMAGSVAEWTRTPAANPANPLGDKNFVIIGGSYLKPENGALAREWTSARMQRRPDLGFRVVLPAQ